MVDYPKAFVLPVSSANRTRPRSVHVFNDSEHILPTSDFHWTTFSPAVATFISSAQFNNNLYTEIHSSPTFWEPIYLSSLAGSSTCLGASVAFLVPMIHKWRNDGKKQSINEADKALRSDRYDDVNSEFVGPDLLSFSLALAGSVMITVCLVSIIPECLDIEERKAAVVVESFDDIFLRRFMGFGIGVGVYALLSQLLNKLPEEYEWGDLLGDAFDLTNDNRTQMETLPQTEAYKGKEAIFYQQMNCTPTCVIQSHHNHLSIPPLPSQSIDESTKSLSSTKSDIGKHPIHNHPDLSMSNPQRKQSPWRLTLLLFLSLLLHNFPEGVAVSLSAASANGIQTKGATSTILSRGTEAYENTFEGANPKSISSVKEMAETIDKTFNSDSFTSDMALSIINQNNLDSSTLKSSRPPSSLASIVTLSIALHNIPEGIAICIPCLKSRPDKPWLAFGLASLSGLAEPIGAFVALVVLKLREEADASLILLNDGSVYEDMGNALAFVAGIMMAVAVFELLPEADRQRKECDNSISFVWGVVIGVGVMVITEFYLG